MVKYPVRLWKKGNLALIIRACIILHNMIVEDERGLGLPVEDFYDKGTRTQDGSLSRDKGNDFFEEFLERNVLRKDTATHKQLTEDLVAHLYARKKRGEM